MRDWFKLYLHYMNVGLLSIPCGLLNAVLIANGYDSPFILVPIFVVNFLMIYKILGSPSMR